MDYRSNEVKRKTDFVRSDLNFDPFPVADASFDLVTAFQILEHLENPFFVMREVKRILRKGGLFVFSVPNPYNLVYRLRYLFTGNMPAWRLDNNHLLFLTKDVFQKTYLSEFELVEKIYQRGSFPFWGTLRNLRFIFGSYFAAKNRKILPPSELLSVRTCYVLRKK